jgi:hypothetical protein
MVSILTITLTLLTCQTWTGKCEEPKVSSWSYEVVDLTEQKLVDEVRACYHIGFDRAHEIADVAKHFSTNVKCDWQVDRNVI